MSNPSRTSRPLAAVSILVAMSLSGCVSGMGRMNEYGTRLADAKTHVGRDTYSMWVHPHEDAILIQKGFGAAMGQSALEGFSLGTANLQARKPIWTQASDWLVSPLGCTTKDTYSIDNKITWEALYACPPGVDLRGQVAAHRETLRQGTPLPPITK